MKKISLFLAVAASAGLLFTSCSQKGGVKDVALTNQTDSVSYAYGLGNGDGIRQYILGADTTPKDIDRFMTTFIDNFKELDPVVAHENDAKKRAAEMKKMAEAGTFFNNAGLTIDKDLYYSQILDLLKNSDALNEEQIKMLIPTLQKMMQLKPDAITPEMAQEFQKNFAKYTAVSIKMQALKDMTPEEITLYVSNLEKALTSTEKVDRIVEKATSVASSMFQQLKDNNGFTQYSIPSNNDALIKGLSDGLNKDTTSKMDLKESMAYFQEVVEIYKAKSDAEKVSQFAPSIQEGKDFLKERAQDKDVQTTASGLEYRIIEKGHGATPTATSTVKVNYEGKLIDGTIFDSSYERGEPAQFPLNQVIKGWTEGIQLMNVGSTYEFYIPYTLAYGEQGAGEQIPPYATLIFKVELLDIVK